MTASLLMIATSLVGQAPAGDARALKVEVARWSDQLDSPSLDKRNAAEEKAHREGPAGLGPAARANRGHVL